MRRGVALVMLGLTLVACSDGPDERKSTGADRTPREQQTPESPDLLGDPDTKPPTAFEAQPAHTLEAGPMDTPSVALHGRAAWLADPGGVTVVDLATGETVTRVEVENEPVYDVTAPEGLSTRQASELDGRIPEPQLVEIEGEPTVLAAVPVQLAPEGNLPAQDGFEVIAMRADDGTLVWRLPVDIYGEPDGKLGASPITASSDGVAVQWNVDGALAGTFAVALDRPRVLWQRTDFFGLGGDDDALFGFRHEDAGHLTLAGVDRDDGLDLWSEAVPLSGIWSGSPNDGPFIKFEDDKGKAWMVEVATGDRVLAEKDGLAADMECTYGGDVVPCWSKRAGALAVDVDTGEVLWQRDAWQGTVRTTYASLAYVDREGGPVVMDARTGEVVGSDPSIAPDRVSPYAGLVFTGEDVEVYLPTR